MARLMLANVDPEASDAEIRDLLVKYGFPPFDAITREPGDGTHPAVVLAFAGVDVAVLQPAQQRVHELFWKGHKLGARLMQDRFA